MNNINNCDRFLLFINNNILGYYLTFNRGQQCHTNLYAILDQFVSLLGIYRTCQT